MKNKNLTLTVLANMTSNYGESLGNIASVQKVYKKGRVYTVRTKESLKNALMVQSGLYSDLAVDVDGAAQKRVSSKLNVSNCSALEGGYMNTKNEDKKTYVRNSSFYVTDAISCCEFVNETRFHNNLYLAQTKCKELDVSLQENAIKSGLMPYQYEYDKELKKYSLTIDLDRIGVDENFDHVSCASDEKARRVNAILSAVEDLALVVKGNLDNAEPLFVVGGISDKKNHVFENLVNVKNNKIVVSEDLCHKLEKGFESALLKNDEFDNQQEVIEAFGCISVTRFFDDLRQSVNQYYGV